MISVLGVAWGYFESNVFPVESNLTDNCRLEIDIPSYSLKPERMPVKILSSETSMAKISSD